MNPSDRSALRRSHRARATSDVDVILVEAAPVQVGASPAELDADQANYLAIEVDDRLATQRAKAGRRVGRPLRATTAASCRRTKAGGRTNRNSLLVQPQPGSDRDQADEVRRSERPAATARASRSPGTQSRAVRIEPQVVTAASRRVGVANVAAALSATRSRRLRSSAAPAAILRRGETRNLPAARYRNSPRRPTCCRCCLCSRPSDEPAAAEQPSASPPADDAVR